MFTVRDGCPFCLSGSRRTAVGAGLSSGLSLALVLGPEVLFFLGLVVRFVLLVFLNRLFQPLKLSGENLVISFVYTPRRLRQPPSPPPGKGNIPVRCLHARRPHKKVPLPGGGDGMSMGGGQAPARGSRLTERERETVQAIVHRTARKSPSKPIHTYKMPFLSLPVNFGKRPGRQPVSRADADRQSADSVPEAAGAATAPAGRSRIFTGVPYGGMARGLASRISSSRPTGEAMLMTA